ncbi:MAG: SAM-dependent methyltransferase [Bacteroidetes bacterium]|nr:SAM-dependent methyltransferase [Bacteroidota bacterium]
MIQNKIVESSFRDPSGFLFMEEGRLLRQVNPVYADDYDFLMGSGLYEKLVENKLMVPHREISGHPGCTQPVYKVIEPETIEFISYPYEWSFSQLKDAALTTLMIQKIALEHGMTLKDSSAYNLQFRNGTPVFIDTLSFEIYHEGTPWAAYGQFCQHFLAPLALMSYTDIRLNQLLKIHLDGIPLDLAGRLLPFKTRLRFSLLMHIHLHAKARKKYEHKGSASKTVRIKRSNLFALIDVLISAVKKLEPGKRDTEWGKYYSFTNYSDSSFSHKRELLEGFLKQTGTRTLWDLGANSGEFTQVAAQSGIDCIAFDIDPVAVETYYNHIKQEKITNVLPLIMDLTNPSPSTGWNNEERLSFSQRPRPDTILALALVHHLAISNNLPLARIAEFLSGLCQNLIIEFVPKTDSQVRKLLESRKDVFPGYDEENFGKEFSAFFTIIAKERIRDSERILYLMKKNR